MSHKGSRISVRLVKDVCVLEDAWPSVFIGLAKDAQQLATGLRSTKFPKLEACLMAEDASNLR